MMKVDANFLKNTYYLDNVLENKLVLTRFKVVTELEEKINKLFFDSDLRVKDFGFKTDYDNAYQDYELMITLGTDEEDLVDLSIYYTLSRIGERVISEVAYEIL